MMENLVISKVFIIKQTKLSQINQSDRSTHAGSSTASGSGSGCSECPGAGWGKGEAGARPVEEWSLYAPVRSREHILTVALPEL